MIIIKNLCSILLLVFIAVNVNAKIIVVNQQAQEANDHNIGTLASPLKTIQAGADLAQPGDTILVKSGIYREKIVPPRSGNLGKPITYLAAPGEFVSIRGSEAISNWSKDKNNVWFTIIENSLFGEFNPYVVNVAGAWLGNNTTIDSKTKYHLGDVYCNDEALNEVFSIEDCINEKNTWFTKQDGENTLLYANFDMLDPNKSLVEINVRPTIIFPEKSGLKYIIIDGFDIRHSASQWCDIHGLEEGAIGMRYGYKWIVQNCTISNSRNNGISMGVTDEVFFSRDLTKGGNNIPPYGSFGFHVIRNNKISRCGQCGIYGCYGAIGSVIENNEITETLYRKEWFGTNQADIKILFPIDVTISGNKFFGESGCGFAIWLDWGAQNVRVTKNLIMDRPTGVFTEVSFGPTIIDNNVFIHSGILDCSDGNVYVHNLFYESPLFQIIPEPSRPFVPYFKAHSTEVMGRNATKQRHERWYNNLFIGDSLRKEPSGIDNVANFVVNNNVYLDSSPKSSLEGTGGVEGVTGSQFRIREDNKGGVSIFFYLDSLLFEKSYPYVTANLIGRTPHSNMLMENIDGTPLNIDSDYVGQKVDVQKVKPGPFQNITSGINNIVVW